MTKYMIPAMDEIGRQFESGYSFVPELLISARGMKAALELIRPLLAAQGSEPVGRVHIGTVKSDRYDIGKNLVGSMLKGAGFGLIDLGADVGPERFMQEAETKRAGLVALSALLTRTMPFMKTTLEELDLTSVWIQVKVIVGGAPVTRQVVSLLRALGNVSADYGRGPTRWAVTKMALLRMESSNPNALAYSP